MVKQHCGNRKAIAFDPSYISKSGKHTPGVGCFWSGCAGKAKWGLEINGIAALGLDNHTALHWYCRIYQLLAKRDLNAKHSPMDLIRFLIEVKRVRINDTWHVAEVTKKNE